MTDLQLEQPSDARTQQRQQPKEPEEPEEPEGPEEVEEPEGPEELEQPEQEDVISETYKSPIPDLSLPIPCSYYQDNYHTPYFWFGILPPIHCWADPVNHPYRWPQPLGPDPANVRNVLGVLLHDFGHVNFNPHKFFIKYMLWYMEINDDLFNCICPSDLNDLPCEWDELQGGCPMLRLCETRHKYLHPHLGEIPACKHELLFQCRYVHDIQPNCRSFARHLQEAPKRRKRRKHQLCDAIARGEICEFGHDMESARIEAAYRYWEHRDEARARGSYGYVKRDVRGRKLLRPMYPADY